LTRQVTVVILRGIEDGCRGRPPRADEANAIDHMLHRGNRREPLFHKTEEFEPFRPNWIDFVAAPLTDTEQKEMQRSISRGLPCGERTWVAKTVRRLGLESTLGARGRPKKLPKHP